MYKNVCAKCEKKFLNWSDYILHQNSINCAKVIKPIKTSSRTKEQIVREFEETFLKGALIQ